MSLFGIRTFSLIYLSENDNRLIKIVDVCLNFVAINLINEEISAFFNKKTRFERNYYQQSTVKYITYILTFFLLKLLK